MVEEGGRARNLEHSVKQGMQFLRGAEFVSLSIKGKKGKRGRVSRSEKRESSLLNALERVAVDEVDLVVIEGEAGELGTTIVV